MGKMLQRSNVLIKVYKCCMTIELTWVTTLTIGTHKYLKAERVISFNFYR